MMWSNDVDEILFRENSKIDSDQFFLVFVSCSGLKIKIALSCWLSVGYLGQLRSSHHPPTHNRFDCRCGSRAGTAERWEFIWPPQLLRLSLMRYWKPIKRVSRAVNKLFEKTSNHNGVNTKCGAVEMMSSEIWIEHRRNSSYSLCRHRCRFLDFGNSLLAACKHSLLLRSQRASATVHCDQIERSVQTPTVSQNSCGKNN